MPAEATIAIPKPEITKGEVKAAVALALLSGIVVPAPVGFGIFAVCAIGEALKHGN